jgi:hypothetical protein
MSTNIISNAWPENEAAFLPKILAAQGLQGHRELFSGGKVRYIHPMDSLSYS